MSLLCIKLAYIKDTCLHSFFTCFQQAVHVFLVELSRAEPREIALLREATYVTVYRKRLMFELKL